MNILYYDCFAGISGDMNLGAMIDLGVEQDYLRAELGKLGIDSEFELIITRGAKSGIHGTLVNVHLENHHAHGHNHGHHHHVHGAHRNLKDIEKIIQASTLGLEIQKTSLDIFHRVARAEAKVHDRPVHEVHFHEVGGTDSLVDIVGAAICYHRLDVDEVWSAYPELGSGLVHCVHGIMPVPAPATVEILQGISTRRGGTDHEATTPTGAAILAGLTDKFTENPCISVQRTGYGIGHRDGKLPNVLRVNLGSVPKSLEVEPEQGRLLQCNIDDMTGEILGEVMDLLMEQGAQDVHFTPIIMKKGRPATLISLLCRETEEDHFKKLLFRHTSTLGIKSFALQKTVLERNFKRINTSLGTVTVKEAVLDGKTIRSKPEFEDCRKIAKEHNLPLSEVYSILFN